MIRLLSVLRQSSGELGNRTSDFVLTKLRFIALAASLAWMTGAIIYAQRIRGRDEEPIAATQVRVEETERRLDILESIKIGERLAHIETLLDENAKVAEVSHNTAVAIAVPVGLLALEGLFRLATAIAAKAKIK